MLAHAIATPVLALAEEHVEGRMLGMAAAAAYADLGGFVVAITARGVPLMPNGLALKQPLPQGRSPRPGTRVRLSPGRLDGPGLRVVWDSSDPPGWDAAVPRPPADAASLLFARGAAILADCGIEPRAPGPRALSAALAAAGLSVPAEAPDALASLLASVATLDPGAAARAAGQLVGRGPGLTPEGDDLLAGAALAVAALAPSCRVPPDAVTAWLAAIGASLGPDRTTALSHTLLRLALAGCGVEPVHALLDLGPSAAPRWRPALHRLLRLGHSTGPAYAAAIGATALLLGASSVASAAERMSTTNRRHEGA